jgi:hypothetical protein
LPSILFQFLTDATCSLEIFFEEENLLAGMWHVSMWQDGHIWYLPLLTANWCMMTPPDMTFAIANNNLMYDDASRNDICNC